MKKLHDTLADLDIGNKYVSEEFQDFGLRLAEQLGDMKHKALYIKLAKEEDRSLLQDALEFVLDSTARSKAKLFMWKLKQLREERGNVRSKD